MTSLTFAVSDDPKIRIEKFPWINWSELAREELLKQEKLQEDLEKLKKIISKSKFTEKDANELAEKVKKSMHERLKKEGLV